ncbi:hypothetical protein C8T65DRAFT_700584 [Cerioporus squamosus]|nr:hypothetical protein C8T65DRAFT_700584 [Cerioporus squamosus]
MSVVSLAEGKRGVAVRRLIRPWSDESIAALCETFCKSSVVRRILERVQPHSYTLVDFKSPDVGEAVASSGVGSVAMVGVAQVCGAAAALGVVVYKSPLVALTVGTDVDVMLPVRKAGPLSSVGGELGRSLILGWMNGNDMRRDVSVVGLTGKTVAHIAVHVAKHAQRGWVWVVSLWTGDTDEERVWSIMHEDILSEM